MARCEGHDYFRDKAWFGQVYRYATFIGPGRRIFRPSQDWSQGGPIIDREGIGCGRCWDDGEMRTNPYDAAFARLPFINKKHVGLGEYGPTPLIAAMRCYVAANLGDEVDVPDELINRRAS